MSEDNTQAIQQCLKTACEKLNREFKPQDFVEQSIPIILEYVKIVKPDEYYQWFCSLWQAMETLYAHDVKEEEWASLVENVVGQVEDMPEDVNPKLRAMCTSYVLASLSAHRLAQARALRILIQMSTNLGLTKEPEFFKWIIGVMKKLLDESLAIRNNRNVFINVLIDFFKVVENYDHVSLTVLCEFFQNKKVSEYVRDNADLVESVKIIAKNALNSAFRGNQIFDFEVIKDTPILEKNLDKEHKAFLAIFVEYGYKEFIQLYDEYRTFISDNGLNEEQMFLNIRMLTLISLIQDKREISIEEAEEQTGLSGLQFKRLVIQLNETKNALIKIVSGSGGTKLQNKYCQPRIFDKEQDQILARGLETAIHNLK